MDRQKNEERDPALHRVKARPASPLAEVIWAKVRLTCRTGQSAGQWSEEAAGTPSRPLMYSGEDKSAYCLAYKTIRNCITPLSLSASDISLFSLFYPGRR